VEEGKEMTHELISLVRSGVVRLAFFKDSEQVGNGSGFLSNDLLVTCSHIIRRYPFDAVEISFGDQNSNPITPIRYTADNIYGCIVNESSENEYDCAILKIDEPELKDRYQFPIKHMKGEIVGEQVLFFGFPFGSQHLTSHVGYISADFWSNNIHVFQIDGSINPGNSGGPLVHIASGAAAGIVTRTQTGLEKDFDDLIQAIKNNITVLKQSREGVRMTVGGIDPIETMQITMSILGKLSVNLKRSSNVGIGYAFSSEHVLETGLLKQG